MLNQRKPGAGAGYRIGPPRHPPDKLPPVKDPTHAGAEILAVQLRHQAHQHDILNAIQRTAIHARQDESEVNYAIRRKFDLLELVLAFFSDSVRSNAVFLRTAVLLLILLGSITYVSTSIPDAVAGWALVGSVAVISATGLVRKWLDKAGELKSAQLGTKSRTDGG